METAHSQIGALIRSRREQSDITQQQLADRAKISRESVNRIEVGSDVSRPRPRNIARLLYALDVDKEDVRDAIEDPILRGDVLDQLGTMHLTSVLDYVSDRASTARRDIDDTDALLISPDGITCNVNIRTGTGVIVRKVVQRLVDDLTPLGWIVTVPMQPSLVGDSDPPIST